MENGTCKIYKNVILGQNVELGDFVVLGVPPRGMVDGELPTIIGNGAVIRSHTVIYAGNQIGENFQTGHHAMVREENRIGDNVSIGTGTVIEHHVVIKDEVRIHSQAFVPEYSVLEEKAWLGPNVVITNAKYPCSPNVKNELLGVTIQAGAIVGANSTLLPGIVLGKQCLVGAGSVVTGDVGEGEVVVGCPAKKIKLRSDLPYVDDQKVR